MSALRTAAQQALEALKSCSGVPHWPALQPTIGALRAALAQQDEPVQHYASIPGTNVRVRLQAEPAQDHVPVVRKMVQEPVATLTAQRDALLEALKDATKTIEHLGYPLAAIERARAAIKAVEETK